MISSFVGAAEQQVRVTSSGFEFVELTRNMPEQIIRQLVGKDGVHEAGADTLENLCRFRLGGPDHDRTCFAIMEGGRIHSAIYVKKFYEPVSNDSDLCGNVRKILTSETSRNAAAPTCMVFYSICNISGSKGGVGQKLVVSLYEHLTEKYPQAILTTLSPVRSYDADFIPEDYDWFKAKSEKAQAKEIVEYLLTGKDLGVQGFHMGNGATPADVNLNAGDMWKDPKSGAVKIPMAMINYRYDNDPDVIANRAEAFKAIKIFLKNNNMDEFERAEKVRTRMMPLIGRELLQKAGMWHANLEEKIAPFESKRVVLVTISAGSQQHLRMS